MSSSRLTCVAQRAEQTRRLVHLGCLAAFLALLRRQECEDPRPPAPGTVNLSLRALCVVFGNADAPGPNPYAAEFRLAGGEARLRSFCHHRCARIAACACRILDMFFDTPPSGSGSPTSVVNNI